MNRVIKFRAWNRLGIMQYGEGKQGLFLQSAINNQAPIMQFTGLLDKNGKEIYEGDVVKHRFEDYDDFTNYVIEWKGNQCQFRGEEVGGERHNLSVYSSMEVIGNIYENPELL